MDFVSACSSKLSNETIFFNFCWEVYFLKPFDFLSSGADILERLVGLRGSLLSYGYISLFFWMKRLNAMFPADSWCQLLFAYFSFPSREFLMTCSSVGRVVFLS